MNNKEKTMWLIVAFFVYTLIYGSLMYAVGYKEGVKIALEKK